jgi:hypothetical protein
MQGIGIYTSAADIPAKKAKRSRHSLRTAVTINFCKSYAQSKFPENSGACYPELRRELVNINYIGRYLKSG